jgi:hypothetical protein
MSDDFFSCSKREGQQQLGIDNLDDPTMMRKVFTALPPDRRLAALNSLECRLVGRTFERSEVREVAKLNRLRRELNERHRVLLRYGR